MMLVNHDTLWSIAQLRQEELLEEMHTRQILQQLRNTKSRNPKLWRKLSWQLGGSMIALGHRLQAQYEPKRL